jgi:hypothetical protein
MPDFHLYPDEPGCAAPCRPHGLRGQKTPLKPKEALMP